MHIRKTNGEDEAEKQFLLRLQLEMPNNRYWNQKDPKVGDEIRDVSEVGESNKVEAFACDIAVPICF